MHTSYDCYIICKIYFTTTDWLVVLKVLFSTFFIVILDGFLLICAPNKDSKCSHSMFLNHHLYIYSMDIYFSILKWDFPGFPLQGLVHVKKLSNSIKAISKKRKQKQHAKLNKSEESW